MMEVRYKCRCMLTETSIRVPFRRLGEDVVQYMQTVIQPAVYLDHRQRSPSCREEKMEYAKIPSPENAPFLCGEPSVQ